MKYYISKPAFFYGLNISEIWMFLVEIIKADCKTITIVDWINSKELTLSDELLSSTNFRNELSYKISVSQNPFLINTTEMYLCYHYKLTDNILSQISGDMLADILETHVTSQFFVSGSNGKRFWMSHNLVGALLHSSELVVFKNLGVDFKEWDVRLNDVI